AFSWSDRPSRRKQDGLVIHRPRKNGDDDHLLDLHPIEDQVVPVHAPADPSIFIARRQRKPLGQMRELEALLAQFLNEARRALWTVVSDVVADGLQSRRGLVRQL